MPHLAELQRKFAPRGLEVLMVSDESEALISAWIKRHNVTVPVAQGKVSNIAAHFGARGYPSSYIVNPNGAVVWKDHPMSATDVLIESMLTGPAATTTGVTPPVQRDNWWVWMLALLAVAFVAALGWFWWRTRDHIPAYLKPPGAGYQPLHGHAPGPMGAVPQAVPPTQGAYLANTPGAPNAQPFHGGQPPAPNEPGPKQPRP